MAWGINRARGINRGRGINQENTIAIAHLLYYQGCTQLKKIFRKRNPQVKKTRNLPQSEIWRYKWIRGIKGGLRDIEDLEIHK